MPAAAEQTVVRPVGSGRAHGDHGDVVNKEHNSRENRQTQPAACYDFVDFIGSGKSACVFLLVAALEHLCDVNIALVGDDGFGIVVKLGFRRLDVLLDMLHGFCRNVQLLKNLVVALKNLDCVPALLLQRHIMHRGFLNVGKGVLNRAGKGVHGNGFCALCGFYCFFRRLRNALALQRGNFNNLAAKLS